ncbi:MAG: hypothetical protein WBA45_02655 [Microthrixaceae bacterium]
MANGFESGRQQALRLGSASGNEDGKSSYGFNPDASMDAPTSIVVPSRSYPNGCDATVVNGAITSPSQSGMVVVVVDRGASTVTVAITRK